MASVPQQLTTEPARTDDLVRASSARRLSVTPLLVLPGLLFLAVFFAYPLLGIVLRSFDPDGSLSYTHPRFSLANYVSIFQDPAYIIILRNTFIVAVVATAVTVVVAYPVAFFMSRLPRRWGARLLILALVPFWISILVRLYAWTQILPIFHIMFTTTGTIVGMVYYLLPYMIAILYATMLTVEPETLNAARTLGARPLQVMRSVFFPLTRSGLYVGSLLLFVISLGFFLTPALLGGGSDITVATYIQQEVNIVNWGVASAMGTALLAITMVLFVIVNQLFGVEKLVTLGSASQKGVSQEQKLRFGPGNTALLLYTVLTFAFLLGPLVVVVLVSFTPTTYLVFPPPGLTLAWYRAFFADPTWLQSAWLSVRVAALTTVCATLLGLLTAVGLERSRFRGKGLIQAAFMPPLIVPVILIAVSLYDFESRLRIAGGVPGYVIGHTILALPLCVIIVRNALHGIGTELEDAATTLGASRRRSFLDVTARLILPSIGVAAIFAFVTSWDEPVIALFLSTGSTTLPVRIFNFMQTEVQPTVAAIATMLMALILLAGVAVTILAARRQRKLASVDSGEG